MNSRTATVTRILRDHHHNPALDLTAHDYRPPWQIGDEALCAQTDPDLWFPPKGGNPNPAKRVCGDCPVRRDCLLWAIQARERHGVWGGISERQRRHLTHAAGHPELTPTTLQPHTTQIAEKPAQAA